MKAQAPSSPSFISCTARRILIDARMVGPVLHGIARYVSLMARGLAGVRQQKSGLPYEPIFIVTPEYKKEHGDFHGFQAVECDAGFLSVKENLSLPRLLRASKAHLYHSPSFSSLLYCPCPSIATVHDLIHLYFGRLRDVVYYRYFLRPFAVRCRSLLTVSRASRRELALWLGIHESDIEIVYNAITPDLLDAVDPVEVEAVCARLGLTPGRYFFCLSNPKPHKNVRLLVESYGLYSREVGRFGDTPLVITLELDTDVTGVVQAPGLTEHEVRHLMAGCSALFFPSLHEGFGLPPVEAAASGIPVVASAIPPHEEALSKERDHIRWVSPNDMRGWVSAFHDAEAGKLKPLNKADRAALVERYSVERLGAHMDRVYRRVLGLEA